MAEKHFLIIRLFIATLLLALGIGSTFFAQHWAQRNLMPKVKAASLNATGEVSTLLNAVQVHLTKVSRDKRMKNALTMPLWNDSTLILRRILYEYSYLYDVPALYFMQPDETPSLIKTAKAASLPENTFQVITDNKKKEQVLTVSIKKVPHFLAIKKFRGAQRKDKPVLALMLPISQVMKDFTFPINSRKAGIKFALYNDRGDGRFAVLDNLGTSTSKLETISQLETDLPLFSPFGAEGFFSLPRGGVIASMHIVPNYNNWRLIAYIPVQSLITKLLWTQIALVLLTIAVVAIVLFVPGPGACNRLPIMKVLGRKIIPKALAKTRKEADGVLAKAEVLQEAALSGVPPAEGGVETPKPEGAEEEKGEISQKEGESNKQHTTKKKSAQDVNKVPKQEGMSENIIAYIIKECIREKRIGLLYQPILDSKTNKVYMHEVYLRLMDADGTVLSPAQFIPVAEKHGLMDKLDEAVIQKVRWQNFGEDAEGNGQRFAINLSAKTLDSLSYINKLLASTGDEKVPEDSIVFELRSEEIIGDRGALDFIRRCKKMGFGFGMDYFGGGERTLRLAKKMKFGYCKLNAFKYQDLATNREKQKEIVRLAMVAKEVEMPLVMERIEDKLMADFCAKVGVQYVQGYYFAEPAAKLQEE